jgi:hypothetical protein
MTHDEKLALLPGDRVTVWRDNNDVEQRTVSYAPWVRNLPDADMQYVQQVYLIRLVGIPGDFPLDRVMELVSKRHGGDE